MRPASVVLLGICVTLILIAAARSQERHAEGHALVVGPFIPMRGLTGDGSGA